MNKDLKTSNHEMDIMVARAVPYTAGLLKDARVALSDDKKKAQDALVIVDKINGCQWASISLIISLILMNVIFTPSIPPQWRSPLKIPYYQRVVILLLSVLPWVIIPHEMNWRQANQRATLTCSGKPCFHFSFIFSAWLSQVYYDFEFLPLATQILILQSCLALGVIVLSSAFASTSDAVTLGRQKIKPWCQIWPFQR